MDSNMIITGLEEAMEEANKICEDLMRIKWRIQDLANMISDARPRIEIRRAPDKAGADKDSFIPI